MIQSGYALVPAERNRGRPAGHVARGTWLLRCAVGAWWQRACPPHAKCCAATAEAIEVQQVGGLGGTQWWVQRDGQREEGEGVREEGEGAREEGEGVREEGEGVREEGEGVRVVHQ